MAAVFGDQVDYDDGTNITVGFIVDDAQDAEGKELVSYLNFDEASGVATWSTIRAPQGVGGVTWRAR